MERIAAFIARPLERAGLPAKVGGAPLRTHLSFAAVFVVLVAAFAFVLASGAGEPAAPGSTPAAAVLAVATSTVPAMPAADAARAAFSGVAIAGSSAIVIDLATGETLFDKNADSLHALASVTKLMTALVAAERLPHDATITIDPDDLAPEGESGFFVGDRFALGDLVAFTLITSSNDGARALATAAGALMRHSSTTDELSPFIDAMNERAAALEMAHTVYRNETGLDVSPSLSGADGTARDVATLLSYLYRVNPGLLLPTAQTKESYRSLTGSAYIAANTNTRVQEFQGLLGSKTGFTDLAGGNLAIVFDADINRPVAVVVLGSTQHDRFSDAQQLAEGALEYYRLRYP